MIMNKSDIEHFSAENVEINEQRYNSPRKTTYFNINLFMGDVEKVTPSFSSEMLQENWQKEESRERECVGNIRASGPTFNFPVRHSITVPKILIFNCTDLVFRYYKGYTPAIQNRTACLLEFASISDGGVPTGYS